MEVIECKRNRAVILENLVEMCVRIQGLDQTNQMGTIARHVVMGDICHHYRYLLSL